MFLLVIKFKEDGNVIERCARSGPKKRTKTTNESNEFHINHSTSITMVKVQGRSFKLDDTAVRVLNITCSKEPKNVTAFDLFTFFRTDLIQSEASWKLSSASDWLMSA